MEFTSIESERLTDMKSELARLYRLEGRTEAVLAMLEGGSYMNSKELIAALVGHVKEADDEGTREQDAD